MRTIRSSACPVRAQALTTVPDTFVPNRMTTAAVTTILFAERITTGRKACRDNLETVLFFAAAVHPHPMSIMGQG